MQLMFVQNVLGGSAQGQYFGAGRMRFDTPNRIREIVPVENLFVIPNPAVVWILFYVLILVLP